MKVVVKDPRTDKVLYSLNDISSESSISCVKSGIYNLNKNLYPHRQCLKLTSDGKALGDNRALSELCDSHDSRKLSLYLRDLGPQVGWRTVFLVEYTGPLFIYLTMWLIRQPDLRLAFVKPLSVHTGLRQLAVACWCGHYVKRLLETIFVHRFSHATMPLRNLFKNCTYYFGFAAFVSYFVNHPLYTFPTFGLPQVYVGLLLFLVGEYGNLCCHLVLKNLRPPGSSVRLIPKPTPGRMLTKLFNFVACPHYFYEVLSWVGFATMTQSLPAAMFAIVGFGQMSVWAMNKLKAYRREFPEYPRNRRAIVPFIL